MKFDKAQVIALDCARALRIAGLQADVPYSQAQLCEVIAAYVEQMKIIREECTLANRRYASANARLARYEKKSNISTDSDVAG